MAVCPSPELTMRLAQRPLRWRRGRPGARHRSHLPLRRPPDLRAAGTVAAGDAGGLTVGADGRIAARVAYRGARTVEFRAHDAAVRIAVRAR